MMMRRLLALIALICGLSSALVVGPAIYEQKDFGALNASQFTYSLSVDCNASAITAVIYNGTDKPEQDVNILLSYVDFAQPLLANKDTDKDGTVLLKLPGEVSLMRGLFILVIQKTGFKSKEVHFDLYPCLHNGTLPPKPPPPPKNKTTGPLPVVTVVSDEGNIDISTPQPPPSQNSSAQPGVGNQTSPPGPASPLPGICPAALILPSILLFKIPSR